MTRPRPPTPPAELNDPAPPLDGHQSDNQRPRSRRRVRAASRELDIPSSPVPEPSLRTNSPGPPSHLATQPRKSAVRAAAQVPAPKTVADEGSAPSLDAARTEVVAGVKTATDAGRGQLAGREVSARRSPAPIQGQRRSVSVDHPDFTNQTRLYTYTEEDYNYLYNSAPEIQNITVGAYEEFWDTVALFRPNLSAEEWRRFYEEKVLPVWKMKDSHNFQNTETPSSRPENDEPKREGHPRASTPTRRTKPAVVIESPISAKRQAQVAENTRHATGSQSPLKRKRGDADERSEKKKPNRTKQASASSKDARTEDARASEVEVVNLVNHSNEEIEADSEGQPTTWQDAPSHPEAIEVSESRAVPEGEKENFTLDSDGMPIMPAPHKHVRTEEAFEAFTNPPSDFLLQAADVHGAHAAAQEEPEDGSWHDIDDFEIEQRPPLDAPHAVARDVAHEDEHEGAANPAMPDAADDGADSEILDELRSEWERHESENRSRQSQSTDDQDTQAILNAATQIPDLGVPLPSSDANYDEYEGAVHYPRLPRMSQEDDEDVRRQGDLNANSRVYLEQQYPDDEEGYFRFEEVDYMDVPPPPDYDVESQTGVDGAEDGYSESYDPYLESQLESQRIKSVASNLIPPRSSRNQSLRQDPRTQRGKPPSSSPQPRSSRPSSPASARGIRQNVPGQPLNGTSHPTISTITIKQKPHHRALSDPNPAISSSPAPEHISNRPPLPITKRPPPAAFRPSLDRVLSDAGTQTDDDRPLPPKPVISVKSAQPNGTTTSATSAPSTVKKPIASAPNRPPATAPPKARFSTGSTTRPTPAFGIPSTIAPKVQTNTTLSTYISTRQQQGYTTPSILYALQQTNANFGLADVVLRSLRATGSVPTGVRGVWTDEDDEVMRGGDARAMKALEVLHGEEGFRVRREGLRVRGLL